MSPRSLVLVLVLHSISLAHDCYNTKCHGYQTIIDCDQRTNACQYDPHGAPTCIPKEGGGDGVDCLSTHFYCTDNHVTGIAACEYTPSTCYDNMCQGTGYQAEKYIICDQSSNTCGANDTTGAPICNSGNIGNGVNCTTDEVHDEYYCQNNLTTGVTQCVYPPKHDCYNSKCSGTGKFNQTVIDCDQSNNRCGVWIDGSPICIITTRGSGVDCTDTSFSCKYDKKTGVASCQKKSTLLVLILWIILGFVACVLLGAGIVWKAKRKSVTEDRQAILEEEEGDEIVAANNVEPGDRADQEQATTEEEDDEIAANNDAPFFGVAVGDGA